MRNLKKKIGAAIFAVLACLSFSNLALAEGQVAGGMSPATFSRTGRQFTYVVPVVRTLTSPGVAGICTVLTATAAPTASADASAVPAGKSPDMGRDGWVMDAAFTSVAITWTSSIGTPLYPGPLLVDLVDNGTAGTLTCSSIIIKGYRWDGQPISETIANIAEPGTYTTNGFSNVTSVAATGCSGWSGNVSFDRLRIRNSNFISLPRRVKRITDIDAICAAQMGSNFTVVSGGASAMQCYTPSSTNTLTAYLTEAANAIAMLKPTSSMTYANLVATGQGCMADRAAAIIRGRASVDGWAY